MGWRAQTGYKRGKGREERHEVYKRWGRKVGVSSKERGGQWGQNPKVPSLHDAGNIIRTGH